MECRDCTDSLTAWMDGEVSPQEKSLLETHLDSCSGCRAEYESLAYTYNLTDQLAEIEVSERVWDGIRSRVRSSQVTDIRERQKPLSWLGRYWLPTAAAVAALLLLALVGPFLTQDNFDRQDRFATFLQQREQQRQERLRILRQEVFQERHQPRSNPFMQPVSHTRTNPFSTENY